MFCVLCFVFCVLCFVFWGFGTSGVWVFGVLTVLGLEIWGYRFSISGFESWDLGYQVWVLEI